MGGVSGVLLAYHAADADDDTSLGPCEVRFGAARGLGSRTERLLAADLVRPLAAAVGFAVRTPKGRGLVLRVLLATTADGASAGAEDRYEVELTPAAAPTAAPTAAVDVAVTGAGASDAGDEAPSAVLAGATADSTAPADSAAPDVTTAAPEAAAAVVETFDASEVECVGAVVLPVVEALAGQVRRNMGPPNTNSCRSAGHAGGWAHRCPPSASTRLCC
jgi:hypothetical protein